MYQEKYNLIKLFEGTTKALRSFIWSDEFFNFAIRIAELIELPPEKDVDLINFLQVLALKGFPVDEASERLNDFLPDLTEEQKEIIIREVAVGFLPILENLWKITPEEEEYEDRVKRYISMMEFYLRRPVIKKETFLESKPREEIEKETKVEAEQIQAQEIKEEVKQEVLPQEERVITISWKEETKEENEEEKRDVWDIPKIEFKIRKEEIKKEEEGPVDLSQI